MRTILISLTLTCLLLVGCNRIAGGLIIGSLFVLDVSYDILTAPRKIYHDLRYSQLFNKIKPILWEDYYDSKWDLIEDNICHNCRTLQDVFNFEKRQHSTYLGYDSSQYLSKIYFQDFKRINITNGNMKQGMLIDSFINSHPTEAYLFYKIDKLSGFKVLTAYRTQKSGKIEKENDIPTFLSPCDTSPKIIQRQIKYFDYDEYFLSAWPKLDSVTNGYIKYQEVYKELKNYAYMYLYEIPDSSEKLIKNLCNQLKPDIHTDVCFLVDSSKVGATWVSKYYMLEDFVCEVYLVPSRRKNVPKQGISKVSPEELSVIASFYW